jgi:nicotinate-nucleotide adenylyltransferase
VSKQPLVGIVGGTFDPIHFGHLRLALEAAAYLALDEVRFIPSARPPHRATPVASGQQRLEMVQLAIANETKFKVDEREYRREGASYMVDTLESLRDELGAKVALLLLMGSDAFEGLTGWHQWQRLLQLAHIVVVIRPDHALDLPNGASDRDLALQKLYDTHLSTDLNELRQKPSGVIYTLETSALEISASNIRKMVAAGQSPRFLLPETVLSYINERNLYR